jgi:hypothetical protein
MSNHEVISAFLDNESFDPQALSEALADPDGRTLLIDLLALRRLMQPDDLELAPVTERPKVPGVIRLAIMAAGLALAVIGGYQMGERSGASQSNPPAPTRMISTATTWQDISGGVQR